MKRYKVIVSYDGTNYHGWQVQDKHITVQEIIEKVLSKINDKPIKIVASGRTDQHVHALNQVFHFDSSLMMNPTQWQKAINRYLPADIYIKKVEAVNDDFHARYNVIAKKYEYYLNMGEYDLFSHNHIYQLNRFLDIDTMKETAIIFRGTHDFSSFCQNSLEETPNQIRTITNIQIEVTENIVKFVFVGDGFLRYMVRMIVGTLIEVGKKRLTKTDVKQMLDACDKTVCHYKAKPEGLYLSEVYY